MGDTFTVSNMFNLLLYVYLPMNNWKKLSFVSQAACVKYMLVLEVVPLPFAFKMFILDEYFDEIIYDYFFFPRLVLVHKPCRLMGFLLILKESHGGKSLSYITTLLLLLISK